VLDLGSGNALKTLAIESRNENAIMQALTEKATKDAGAVKVITVVTLIYLPATAVLVFTNGPIVLCAAESCRTFSRRRS
jgi:hypothetical protein